MSDPSLAVRAAVRRGVRLFNLGRYLSAHQEWEAVWADAPVEDRALLEGLVQLASGLHLRTRRGATRGAVHLLSQAMILLDDHRPSAHGVDIDRLLADFDAYIAWLKKVDRPHKMLDRLQIPLIR